MALIPVQRCRNIRLYRRRKYEMDGTVKTVRLETISWETVFLSS